jgi:ketosteroid isomerase-like protein
MPTTDQSAITLAIATRFEQGFNARNVPALLADMAADVVFEHVAPPTSSMGRFVGHQQVGAVFASLDQHFPNFDLQPIEIFASGDRATCLWQMSFDLPPSAPPRESGTAAPRGLLRGCDVLRIRDGKIIEKLMYISFQ